jgi:hypothetical protein
MKSKSFLVLTGLLASLCITSLVAAGPLGSGPYSSMSMLLEKTFLKVDVLTVNVVVGKKAQGEMTKLAQGKQYSEGLGEQIAKVAIGADDALVTLTFQRDVSLDQWIDAVRENLTQARKAGLMTADTEKKVSEGLPTWFAAIKDRGYEKNDKLSYRVTADSLHTKVVSAGGTKLVEFKDSDKSAPRVVMASYFAPGSDFREPLLKSLFK